jgi:hypothetical protein
VHLIGFGGQRAFWIFLELFGAPTCGAVFPFGFCESLFLSEIEQISAKTDFIPSFLIVITLSLDLDEDFWRERATVFRG